MPPTERVAYSIHDDLPRDETRLVDEGLGAANDKAAPLHEVKSRRVAGDRSDYRYDSRLKRLALLAAALILVHNHPSGVAEPSRVDEFLTQTLKSALALVDIRVLDHLIVARKDVLSFAKRGLI